jgi:hypothetical protein
MSLALLDSVGDAKENLTYQGSKYFLKTTTNNGSTWSNVKISDLVFKLRIYTGTNSVSSTQQSVTKEESTSLLIGNKQSILSTSNPSSNTPGMRYYQLFRCTNNITVDKIQIRTGSITGSYSSNPLLAGIMTINNSGFYTGWAGSSGDAKALWIPVASTWNEITLNQSVTLLKDNIYAIGWYDYQSGQSASRLFNYYTTSTPNAGYETVRGKNSSFEPYDSFVTVTSTNSYIRATSLLGWFIRDSSKSDYEANAYQGVAYGTITPRSVYSNNVYNQSLNIYSLVTIDKFSLSVYNNGQGAYHSDKLHVDLYNPSNQKIWSGAQGDFNFHMGNGYSWFDYYMSTPITLTPGKYYFKVWSNCGSSSTSYSIMSLALLDTAGNIKENLTYQGARAFLKTSTNNGSSWTNVKISDLVFSIRIVPSIGWTKWANISNPDSTNPWYWNFNFPNGRGFYEFYSIGKKIGIQTEREPLIADAKCFYNKPYTITLTTSGTGTGTIQASPSGSYYYGTTVTIWANATIGSTFTGFSGALTGTTTPQTLIMDGDKTIDAAFTLT